MTHFIERCKICKRVTEQCRCIGEKEERWTTCDDCLVVSSAQQLEFNNMLPERVFKELRVIEALILETSREMKQRLTEVGTRAVLDPNWVPWKDIPVSELLHRAGRNVATGDYLDAICLLAMVRENEGRANEPGKEGS